MADVWDELALLQSSPSTAASEPVAPAIPTAQPTSYSLGQLGFDIPAAAATAGAGLLDVLSLPVTAAARGLGASPEEARYFALSKELAKAKTDLAQQLDVRPDTLPQEAMSFLAPSPLSKAKVASQLGTNLLSYLGFKGAQYVAPESTTTQILGAALAPSAITRATGLARATIPAARQSLGIITGNEAALQRAANEAVLKTLGTEGTQRLAEAIGPGATYGTGGVPLTLAEIAQTPSSALGQLTRQTNTAEGALLLTPAAQARQEALTQALGEIGTTPQTGEFPLLLQDAAAAAAAKKAASESSLAQSLGLTPEFKAATTMERGQSLLEGLLGREKQVKQTANVAWSQYEKESKSTKLDVKDALTEALNTFDNYGALSKADTSKSSRRIMATVRDIVENKNGFATVGDIQDLRAAAGRAATKASGINNTEQSLMKKLRESIDTAGLKYAYEQDIGVPGGLPGTAATASDLNALGKLSKAIEATRTRYQTFGEDVVGSLLKVRKNKLTTKASDVLNKVLAKPENVQEIIGKFGSKSDEALTVRAEFLSRLEKANNPTEFLGKHQDTARSIFKNDYSNVAKYAQSVGQKSPLENYANITDSMIPKKIFSNVRETDAFVKQFKGTLAHDFAKSRFLTSAVLTKGGDPIQKLNQNKAIANKLFGRDTSLVESILKDKVIADSPTKLATLATKGQSWTAQMRTAYGAMLSSRGLVDMMKKGLVPTGITGAALGITLGPAGAFTSAVLGSAAGYAIQRIGNLRESQLNALESQIYANPRLLQLASAKPTPENTKRFADALMKSGIIGGETEEAISQQETQSNVWDELAALDNEIQSFKGTTEAPITTNTKIGKQNISIPTGESYAPPELVKAVIKAESAGKADAVSSKGAQGLMQLMPKTAKELGVDPTDPIANVEGGSRYLQQLISKYKSQDIALAAYNWGPGNIDKAISKLKARDKEVTWENIRKLSNVPLETRMYVSKVLKA